MTDKEAINVLIQGVLIAQKQGAYSIQDAALIYEAIKQLAPEAFNKNENAVEETETK